MKSEITIVALEEVVDKMIDKIESALHYTPEITEAEEIDETGSIRIKFVAKNQKEYEIISRILADGDIQDDV